MATKTYLQLINNVLTNLRESTVSDLSESYTLLIGEYVNQAKEKVEDAWKWEVLKKELTFSSGASTSSYDLSDTGVVEPDANIATDRAYLLYDKCNRPMMFDVTDTDAGDPLEEISFERYERLLALDANEQDAEPSWFAIQRTTSGLTVHLYQTPSAVRDYQIHLVVPQDELTDVADVLTVPWRPVVSLATALAMEERGEELGPRAALFFQKHEEELARAIARDGDPEDFTMTAV